MVAPSPEGAKPMRSRTSPRNWLIVIAALGSVAALTAGAAESEKESAFRFRFVGPKVGNRIAAVAGVVCIANGCCSPARMSDAPGCHWSARASSPSQVAQGAELRNMGAGHATAV